MNKIFKSLCFIYLLQFFATSCDVKCNCPKEIDVFEILYNSLELKAFDTSGFQESEISSIVNKNSFGLTVTLLYDLIKIGYNNYKINELNLSSFGFSPTYACTCPSKEVLLNPINKVEIMVTNVNNQETKNVTSKFSTQYRYNEEEISIDELIGKITENDFFFALDLVDYEDIPNSSIFTIKIILESGVELIEQTKEINFEE